MLILVNTCTGLCSMLGEELIISDIICTRLSNFFFCTGVPRHGDSMMVLMLGVPSNTHVHI